MKSVCSSSPNIEIMSKSTIENDKGGDTKFIICRDILENTVVTFERETSPGMDRAKPSHEFG